MIDLEKLSSMQPRIPCAYCAAVVAVQQCEGLNNGEIKQVGISDSRLQMQFHGSNLVVSMEPARARLARQKTVAVEAVLQQEYLEELAKWMEDARAERALRKKNPSS